MNFVYFSHTRPNHEVDNTRKIHLGVYSWIMIQFSYSAIYQISSISMYTIFLQDTTCYCFYLLFVSLSHTIM